MIGKSPCASNPNQGRDEGQAGDLLAEQNPCDEGHHQGGGKSDNRRHRQWQMDQGEKEGKRTGQLDQAAHRMKPDR